MYNNANVWGTWGDVFTTSLQDLWYGFIQFTPKLLIAIVFFIVIWVFGSIVAKAIEQVFASLKVDKMLQSVGTDNLLRRAGMNLNSGHFVGQLVKWFIIVVALLASLSVVLGQNNEVTRFLREDVLGYLPNVVVAVLILIIATVLADVLGRASTASARSMNLVSANMLGAVVRYAVWIFAITSALSTLGVAEYQMSVLFTGIVFMLSLGGALAFGLGGRDAAARLLAKIGEETSSRN